VVNDCVDGMHDSVNDCLRYTLRWHRQSTPSRGFLCEWIVLHIFATARRVLYGEAHPEARPALLPTGGAVCDDLEGAALEIALAECDDMHLTNASEFRNV
jgi:hypothetical protein